MDMKIILPTALFFLIFISCMKKEPMAYYNKAVYAGNMAISLSQLESRIERIQDSLLPPPIDLANRVDMQVQVSENYLSELNGFLGNEETDPMIYAAINYLQYDIETAKNQKTIDLLNEVDQVSLNVDLKTIMEKYSDHINSIFDQKEVLFETYDFEVSRYAKAHDIEEKFYGPDLQPINRTDK